jgi:hypothetical protein
VNNLVERPLTVQFETEDRARGRIELSMPYPHKNRGVGLEAGMIDSDGDFGLSQLGPGVLVADRAYLEDLDRKRTVDLGIWDAHHRIADLNIVAELKIATFLREATHGPAIAQRRKRPQILTDPAIDLGLVQSHLFPVEPHGTRFQDGIG